MTERNGTETHTQTAVHGELKSRREIKSNRVRHGRRQTEAGKTKERWDEGWGGVEGRQ